MFRRSSTDFTIASLLWSRGPLPGRYVAGFTFGVLGTLYYARHKIYADASSDGSHTSFDFYASQGKRRHGSAYHGDETQDCWNVPHQHDKTFREYSATCTILGESGIGRIDAVAVPNYIPRRDACALSSVKVNTGSSWTFFGLFDGYNGYDNKDYVASHLVPALLDALTSLTPTYEPPSEHVEVGMSSLHNSQTPSEEPHSDAVDGKIKATFLEVDSAIVSLVDLIFSSPSKAAAMKPLSTALSGTSSLLSFYDLDTRLLKVALAGNSRAVLGRRAERKNGDQRFSYYEVHVLTADQTSHENTREQLAHARPGTNERTFTRSFGLAAHKWSREIQERVHQEYLGDAPTPNNLYPYLTAEPEITTIEVKPGDFLIMASDGLWNSLTSEEAVGLVGLWLDKGMYQPAERLTETATQPPFTPPFAQIIHPNDLPVSLGAKDETVMYRRWNAEKQFVCVDINAAGHLARNALGGANGDLTAALLSVEPPRSRKLRNDINTAVIFFDG